MSVCVRACVFLFPDHSLVSREVHHGPLQTGFEFHVGSFFGMVILDGHSPLRRVRVPCRVMFSFLRGGINGGIPDRHGLCV